MSPRSRKLAVWIVVGTLITAFVVVDLVYLMGW